MGSDEESNENSEFSWGKLLNNSQRNSQNTSIQEITHTKVPGNHQDIWKKNYYIWPNMETCTVILLYFNYLINNSIYNVPEFSRFFKVTILIVAITQWDRSYYRAGNWGTEKWSHWPKVYTKVVGPEFKPWHTVSRFSALMHYAFFKVFWGNQPTKWEVNLKWSECAELGFLNIINVDPLSLLQWQFYFYGVI